MQEHAIGRVARPRAAHRRRNAGTVHEAGPFLWVSGYEDPIALERGLRDFFLKRRATAIDDVGNTYPETTTHDVVMVATILRDEARRYTDKRRASTADVLLGGIAAAIGARASRDDDYADHRDAVERFERVYRAIAEERKSLELKATYPGNASFWREAGRLVVRLGVAKANPPTSPTLAAALVDSAKELPETLNKTAAAITRAAMGPVRGALKELLVPLGIGAAALAGVVLVTRSSSKREGRS